MFLADAAATHAAGLAIGTCLHAGDVVTLSGPLGAGKTTIARGMIEALGLVGEVASPTFPIVIAYEPPDVRIAVAHVDLYRVDNLARLDELGLDDLRDTSVLIVEWPERGDGFADALALTFSIEAGGETRRLTAAVPDGWEARWPFR